LDRWLEKAPRVGRGFLQNALLQLVMGHRGLRLQPYWPGCLDGSPQIGAGYLLSSIPAPKSTQAAAVATQLAAGTLVVVVAAPVGAAGNTLSTNFPHHELTLRG